MRLSQGVDQIFGGKISPPPGMAFAADPKAGLGKLVGTGVNLFILLCAMFLLFYMLWGAFDWITSSGEKEKIQKAQNKITNAVIGMVGVFLVLVVFGLITGNILGLVTKTSSGWEFNIPSLAP